MQCLQRCINKLKLLLSIARSIGQSRDEDDGDGDDDDDDDAADVRLTPFGAAAHAECIYGWEILFAVRDVRERIVMIITPSLLSIATIVVRANGAILLSSLEWREHWLQDVWLGFAIISHWEPIECWLLFAPKSTGENGAVNVLLKGKVVQYG